MASSNWLPGHDTPPAPSHVAESLRQAFKAQGHHHGALFLAHSYGSTYAKFALQFCPNIVRGCVLVEPASMLCHLPKMTKSFMYTLGAEGWRSPLSVMFRLEPHVAVSLRRHFGLQNLMFLNDLTRVCPAAVLVSKGDTIMASDAILEHATQVRLINHICSLCWHVYSLRIRLDFCLYSIDEMADMVTYLTSGPHLSIFDLFDLLEIDSISFLDYRRF